MEFPDGVAVHTALPTPATKASASGRAYLLALLTVFVGLVCLGGYTSLHVALAADRVSEYGASQSDSEPLRWQDSARERIAAQVRL